MKYEYCPYCGAAWNPWGDEKNASKCWACGHVVEEMAIPEESAPEKCDDHPKYKGIGLPTADCLVCWKMHKAVVVAKIKELSNN